MTPTALHSINLGAILKELAPLSLSDPTDAGRLWEAATAHTQDKDRSDATPRLVLPVAPAQLSRTGRRRVLQGSCQAVSDWPTCRTERANGVAGEQLHCSIATAHRRKNEAMQARLSS